MAHSRRTTRRVVAAAALVLISPAALFMSALVARGLQPPEHEPARSMARIVPWFAARRWTLWVLLIALPFMVVVMGFITLTRTWREDAGLRGSARLTLEAFREHLATLLLAAATLAAAGVLAIVGVHMLTD